MRVERVVIMVTLAVIGARIAFREALLRPRLSDFGQAWAAAGLMLDGVNPYVALGPGRAFEFAFPLLYPLPAVLVAAPFTRLPPAWADAVFMGLGSAVLAWALTRHTTRNPQLLVFLSFAFLTALGDAQWSLLVTGASLVPFLGFLLACKPTIGLALMAAHPSWRALLGAGGFAAATVAIWPWWVQGWLTVLSSTTHMVAPVTLWGGPLVLLALLRWRRPEARLLVGMACVPHSPVLYEAVPLFLTVQRWREGVLLALLTPLVRHLQELPPVDPSMTFAAWTAQRAQWQVLLLYLPCLVMVLGRPNVGTAHEAFVASARQVGAKSLRAFRLRWMC